MRLGGGDSKDAKRPLNELFNEKFNDDQDLQTQKNFERKYILSFCYLKKDEWLFVGIYESLGTSGIVTQNGREYHKYNTKLTDIGAEFIGKLVVGFKKDFRQSYPNLETCLDNLEVVELKREVIKA